MQLNNQFLDKLSCLPIEGESVNVTLFVVSKTNQRLKKINLTALTAAQQKVKLQQWGIDKRFVAVIETADKIVAHAYFKFAEHLAEQRDLAINGKDFSVNSLTEEQAEQLASIIDENLESYLISELEEDKKDKAEAKKESSLFLSKIWDKGYLYKFQGNKESVIARVKNILATIALDCWKHFEEEQREEKELKEANDRYFDIRRAEIKKTVMKNEIIKQSIQHVDFVRNIKA